MGWGKKLKKKVSSAAKSVSNAISEAVDTVQEVVPDPVIDIFNPFTAPDPLLATFQGAQNLFEAGTGLITPQAEAVVETPPAVEQPIVPEIPDNTNGIGNAGQAAVGNSPVPTLETLIQRLIDALNNRNSQVDPYYDTKQKNLKLQRDQEYKLLKEAYGIQGDTWETAKASDTIGEQNLQNFKDKWEKNLSENSYSKYDLMSNYGSYSNIKNPYEKSQINEINTKSGYIGGIR
jgi:hypothetical protein